MYTNVDTELHQSALRRGQGDFDASPKLVAQLQQAQAVLNLPAGLPLTSFITPDGRLYFGAGYLPAEGKNSKPSFREAADEALARFANRSTVEEQSFQLELEQGKRLALHFFLLSMLSSPLLFAIDNLKLNSKLDYTSDSLDGPLITGDDAQSGFVPGKPNYVIIYGEGYRRSAPSQMFDHHIEFKSVEP